jgi:uncharacterized protein YyaL (SSP411 family)
VRRAIVLWLLFGCGQPDTASRAPEAAPSTARGHVDWSPWQRATFLRARAENRIILVNVVATWCHWCHVMEETTYTDPEVAELLATHFVTIRVDSDARPDVAERYREWGWPATGFLSPDARPVLELRGYRNPRDFAKLLRELVADRDAGELAHRVAPAPARAPTDVALADVRSLVVAQLDRVFEPELGGWGKRQRYPWPMPVEHAFLRARAHGEAPWRDRALLTLTSSRKLIDPVWGGMYQYSIADWDHPHYEKITAIQAGAITTYAIAARVTGDDEWLASAYAVHRYMREHMRDAAGGFAASQDADLRRTDAAPVLGREYYARSDAQRRAIGHPRVDTAVYADLNGAMIDALCELYAATLDREVLATAVTAANRVLAEHGTDDGAFTHGAQDDPRGLLYLRDQAAMGRALLSLYRVTGDRQWLARAERVAKVVLQEFVDPSTGGFFAQTEDPEAIGALAERRMPHEEIGLTARFLLKLHRHLDGDGTIATPYASAAGRALAAVGDPILIEPEGRAIGMYAMALEEATLPVVDVTVVGDPSDARTRGLYDAALRWYEPRAVLEPSTPGDRYPDVGKPAVYLCTDTACSTPITDATVFAAKADAFVQSSVPTQTGE